VIEAVGLEGPPERMFSKEDYEKPYDRLKEYFDIKTRSSAMPGDLLVFQYGDFGTHFGIATNVRGRLGFVHVDNNLGRVVENALDGSWLNRFARCYSFREKSE